MVAPFFRSWGYPGVFLSKMANSESFECISPVKNKQNPLPKHHIYWRAWIHAIGRTFLPKDLRVRSEHFEDHCLHRSYLMRVRIALLTGEWLDTHLITRLEDNFKHPISCIWYIYNPFKIFTWVWQSLGEVRGWSLLWITELRKFVIARRWYPSSW